MTPKVSPFLDHPARCRRVRVLTFTPSGDRPSDMADRDAWRRCVPCRARPCSLVQCSCAFFRSLALRVASLFRLFRSSATEALIIGTRCNEQGHSQRREAQGFVAGRHRRAASLFLVVAIVTTLNKGSHACPLTPLVEACRDSFGKLISWLANFTFSSIALRALLYLSMKI